MTTDETKAGRIAGELQLDNLAVRAAEKAWRREDLANAKARWLYNRLPEDERQAFADEWREIGRELRESRELYL